MIFIFIFMEKLFFKENPLLNSKAGCPGPRPKPGGAEGEHRM